MNLKQIRERIERALRHAPETQDHRDEIRDRVNDAQRRLVLSEKWSFRRRLFNMLLKADVALTSSDYTLNPTASVPSSITGGEASPSNSILRGIQITLGDTGWEPDDLLQFEGQVAEYSGATGASVLNNGRWVIEKAWHDSGSAYFIISPNSPSTISAFTTTITLKGARYRLPVDCADIDYIVMRDSEDWILEETPLSREARLLLKEDDGPGVPRTYIVSPNYPDTYELRHGNSYRLDYVQGPMEAPTLAETTGGSLATTATYQYRYAWKQAGIVSAPSPIAEITLTGSNNQVDLSDLEVQGSTSNCLGREKIIYRRRLYSDHEGPWYAVGGTYSYDATWSDDGSFAWPGTDPVDSVRQRQFNYGNGTHKWIRVWPTPDQDYTAEVHYYSRPPDLESDSDEPVMPVELHQALVHLVVYELAMEMKGGKDLATVHHNRLYNDDDGILTIARRNYLGNRGVRHQKQGVMMGGGTGFDTWIQPPTFTEL